MASFGCQPPKATSRSAPSSSINPIGDFHIDTAEVRTEEGRLYLFVTIDRTSKFAFAVLHDKATQHIASNVLRALAVAVPYRIHTVLTDNGTHFTKPGGNG